MANGSSSGSGMPADDDDDLPLDLFSVPEGYYPPSPKATEDTYTLLSGDILTLSLVGHNPLWGHRLWNGGRSIARYLEQRPHLVEGKTVLELGAGAGLPGLVAGLLSAERVVITDFPDPDLIETIWKNIDRCNFPSAEGHVDGKGVVAAGYCWGGDPQPIYDLLGPAQDSFDLMILADLLFNHSQHEKLVSTMQSFLKHGGQALVFFVPYLTWNLKKDLAFFDLAAAADFKVEKMLEEVYDKAMFEEDPGDDLLKRTLFGYLVTR